MAQRPPKVKRYQINHIIGQGGMGTVYHALDRLTGNTVAFKHVIIRDKQLPPESTGTVLDFRLALTQEFRTLASLRHPNIISVLDYGFDENFEPYFTMELLVDSFNIIEAGIDQPFDIQIDLLVQTLQALVYLHRRDIIHRDLKPDNIHVVDGHVKVLDFGLATQRRYLENREDGSRSGTLEYMAPELLTGSPASKASDLYAVGVIAYELFMGRHPFDVENISNLVYDVLHTAPNLKSLERNERAAEILGRLLAKTPQERYADASELLDIYARASGQEMTIENSLTRESLLQAARFVGREAEWQHLTSALAQALHGVGSAWLVGGESGVGKSRLVDELRTQALVDGALVLRGQSIMQGGVPYMVWHDVLRYLCLQTELSDLEASVIKSLVSDVSVLIGRKVADAAELDPQTTQNRLMSVIEDIFQRQLQPIVILLEDLQWADTESLELLKRLSKQVHRLALLLVCNFRDDEQPDLWNELPDMQVLKLKRLTRASIADLSASMLGEKVGRLEQVTDLLERETEGNVFFIVEVVRALAEEAGQLDGIGVMTLPKKVFAEGMKTVLQRRLSRVPSNAHYLLNLAAIAGRQIDLNILRMIAPETDLSGWLTACANAAVLDVQDENWRFAHDKLRESLLESMSETQRKGLHKRVAEVIEIAYPNQPERAAILAYHWGIVGNVTKEAYYLAQAGEKALSAGAYKDARGFLERALVLYDQLDLSQRQRAHFERLIGRTYLSQGQLNDARQHCQRALALSGYPIPSSGGRLALALLKQIGGQVWYRTMTGIFARSIKPAPDPIAIKVAVHASENLAEINYYNNLMLPTLYHALQGLNLAERAGPQGRAELARFYSSMAGVTALIPLKKLSRTYTRLADEALKGLDDPDSISWVMLSEGTHDMQRGDWDSCLRRLQYGMQMAEVMGHSRRWQENAVQVAQSYLLMGRWDEAQVLYARIYDSALQQGNLQGQEWGLIGQAGCEMYRNRLERALELLKEAETIHQQTQSYSNHITAYGTQVQIYMRFGDLQSAGQYVERVKQLTGNSSPTGFSVLPGYLAMFSYYLGLWETQKDDSYKLLAKSVLKRLHRGANLFEIGQPSAWISQGRYDWFNNQPEKAYKSWTKAITEARQLQMPFEEAIAHFYLGQYGKNDEHLHEARRIFARLGTAYHLTKGALV